MNVRHVRVVVHERRVPVRMGVLRSRWIIGTMGMPMVLVMHVEMLVFECFVAVHMGMAFPKQRCDTEGHEHHR